MRAKNPIALAHEARDPDCRRLLANRQMAGALDDALTDHVADFFFDDTNENHPLKSREQRFGIFAIQGEGIVIRLGIREGAE
jgi:hypothetical protein